MDFGKSFTYMFDDKEWVKKLAIGGLLTLLSIIPGLNIFTGLVLAGYGIRVLKNVADGSDQPLPEWDDWGGDWMKGLMLALAAIIYAIPAIIASGIGGGIGSVMGSGSSDVEGLAGLCVAAFSCLAVLWGLLIGIFFPAATIKYAMGGTFSSFFQIGEIWTFIRENAGNYIIALLLMIVAGLVSSLGVIACGIGVFFTSFWSSMVTSHLLGQVKATASPAAAATPYGGTSYGEFTSADALPPEEKEGGSSEQS